MFVLLASPTIDAAFSSTLVYCVFCWFACPIIIRGYDYTIDQRLQLTCNICLVKMPLRIVIVEIVENWRTVVWAVDLLFNVNSDIDFILLGIVVKYLWLKGENRFV